MEQYIHPEHAINFLASLEVQSVDLLCTDPPFYGIVSDDWDNQWPDETVFAHWLVTVFHYAKLVLKPHGSIVFFAGIGKHGSHPLFQVMSGLEKEFTFRNWITWKKRRAYGKSHDYLFCREEILWYSVSAERTAVTFNIPLLNEKRGYAGFNPDYPAKSEYKRVSNVWDDIPELMRPTRSCEKPIPLMRRLIETHSNPGDVVLDCFAGTGATGVAAINAGRRFLGCERDPDTAVKANERCNNAHNEVE